MRAHVCSAASTCLGRVRTGIQPAAPGIFTDSAGHAAVLNQDYSLNEPANPAPVGSYISVYLTGQGAVDPEVGTGATCGRHCFR